MSEKPTSASATLSPATKYPCEPLYWDARTTIGHPGGWLEVPLLAYPLGFRVPVALGEALRMQLQSTGGDFRERLEELLRWAYRVIGLSQTADCGFYGLAPPHLPPDDLLLTFGAAPDHHAVTLMAAPEIYYTPPLDPASPEATIPAREYHLLPRPLHTAIAPIPPEGLFFKPPPERPLTWHWEHSQELIIPLWELGKRGEKFAP